MRRAKPGSSSKPRYHAWHRVEKTQSGDEFIEKLVAVNRTAKVVKGGRQFGFTALTVVGDGARPRRLRLRQGARSAGRHPEGDGARRARTCQRVACKNDTLHYAVHGRTARPACACSLPSDGTGVIAGGGMRAVLECAGVRNVLAKSYGSRNPINVVRATINALAAHPFARRHRGEARQDARRDHGLTAMASAQIKVTLVKSVSRAAAEHRAPRCAGSACAASATHGDGRGHAGEPRHDQRRRATC